MMIVWVRFWLWSANALHGAAALLSEDPDTAAVGRCRRVLKQGLAGISKDSLKAACADPQAHYAQPQKRRKASEPARAR